jgi:hypothetical protein
MRLPERSGRLTKSLKIQVFYDVTPCQLVTLYRRFRSAYCLYRNSQVVQAESEFLDYLTLKMEAVLFSDMSIVT